jgi:predicted transcriptional regulator
LKYRCKIELAADLLLASLKCEKKTHIMNGGKLNSEQLKHYLKMMLDSGMLCFDPAGESYFITVKGKKFLKLYKSFLKVRLETEKLNLILRENKCQLEEMCLPNKIES